MGLSYKLSRRLDLTSWIRGSLRTWSERRYARRSAIAMLDAYYAVRPQHPQLSGESLYECVIMQHRSVDLARARAVIDRAEQSYARWPVTRNLTFRDVVQYVVVSEFTARADSGSGTQTDMSVPIKAIIPDNL